MLQLRLEGVHQKLMVTLTYEENCGEYLTVTSHGREEYAQIIMNVMKF